MLSFTLKLSFTWCRRRLLLVRYTAAHLRNLVAFGTLLSTGESDSIWIASEEETAVTFTYMYEHFEILC